jgi:tRNA-dihydrouridine synthase
MIRETGCAGVVVGRGCLGRPWLFADLAAAFAGRATRAMPTLHQVSAVMRRHAQLLAQLMGEQRGLADFRKHAPWYLKGFAVGAEARRAFAEVSSLADLDRCARALGADQPFPAGILGQPRGRTTALRAVALPAGWLSDRDDREAPRGAELALSGG